MPQISHPLRCVVLGFLAPIGGDDRSSGDTTVWPRRLEFAPPSIPSPFSSTPPLHVNQLPRRRPHAVPGREIPSAAHDIRASPPPRLAALYPSKPPFPCPPWDILMTPLPATPCRRVSNFPAIAPSGRRCRSAVRRHSQDVAAVGCLFRLRPPDLRPLPGTLRPHTSFIEQRP